MLKRLALVLITAVVCSGVSRAAPAVVTIQGRKLLVNGNQFNIQGVDYSPVPVGDYSSYIWGGAPAIYNSDLPLIKAMGANTIRTYQEGNITPAFLDSAYQNGIYVIVGWNGSLWGQDFSNAATNASDLTQFTNFVNTHKSHPAVLMWCFGNEVEAHAAGGPGAKASWYAFLKQVAVQMQTIDPNHPITTANQDIAEIGDPTLNADDASLSSSNFVWGVNAYRGKDFNQAFFTQLSTSTAKPFFLSEFGCDAYNGTAGIEDQNLQDTYIRAQWGDIASNLTSTGKDCLGGLVFEWCDEWWKGDSSALNPATIGGGGVNGPNAHDTETDWINSAYTDDPDMNEEWWGLVAVAAGTAVRTPRLAYNSLKGLWYIPPVATTASTGTAVTSSYYSSTIIQNEIKSYPNPFIAGRDIAKIEFTVDGAPQLEVIIFDLRGNKIYQQNNIINLGAGLMTAEWNGRDENNNCAPAGLYICRVKASTSGKEETKYRKIVLVK